MKAHLELNLSPGVANQLRFATGCFMGKVVVAGSADPDLIVEIMGLIESYCEAMGVTPCPDRAALRHAGGYGPFSFGMDCAATATSDEDFVDVRARASGK